MAGGPNSTGSGVNFETVTQLRGRVASRLSADGVAFEQLDPASARMRTRALVGEELDSWVAYQVNRGLPSPSPSDTAAMTLTTCLPRKSRSGASSTETLSTTPA